MRFSRIWFGFILCLSLVRCKKEALNDCLGETQKTTYLNSLAALSNDTTTISAAERQLMNEIRAIANDVDALSSSIDTTISIHEYYEQISANFLHHVDLVEQKANTFYNGNEAQIILAKNTFVLMSYDALQRKYPEFMWLQLGIFVANEVRSGLVLALETRYILEQNHSHIIIDNSGTEMTDAMLLTSKALIQGQIDVFSDIGSLGILNRKIGAAKIKNETWLTAEAKEGFIKQELAEHALNTGNCSKFMDLQTEAAIQFGAHEQIYILQPMWDKPLMQQFSNLNILLMQVSKKQFIFFGDIFVGTNKNIEVQNGYTIKLPTTINDLSNAQQRVEVARNGFNTLNQLRKNAEWNNWIAYSQLKIGYGIGLYMPSGPL